MHIYSLFDNLFISFILHLYYKFQCIISLLSTSWHRQIQNITLYIKARFAPIDVMCRCSRQMECRSHRFRAPNRVTSQNFARPNAATYNHYKYHFITHITMLSRLSPSSVLPRLILSLRQFPVAVQYILDSLERNTWNVNESVIMVVREQQSSNNNRQ